MRTNITTALAILLLAGASGAAMAQDREHGERGQAAPQAHPQPQRAGPQGGGREGGGGHFGGARGGPPRTEGAPRGGERAEHAGPSPGAFQRHEGEARAPQERGPQQRGPQERGPQERAGQRPPAGAERFSREATPGAATRGPVERGPANRGAVARAPGGQARASVFFGTRAAPSHWQAGRFPSVMSAQSRFHAGAYRAPYGYHYRAWGFGDFLPRQWFVRDYWLTDFLDFDLPYPPPGFMWVRVGPDALMIDRFSGRIAQVVRGVFW